MPTEHCAYTTYVLKFPLTFLLVFHTHIVNATYELTCIILKYVSTSKHDVTGERFNPISNVLWSISGKPNETNLSSLTIRYPLTSSSILSGSCNENIPLFDGDIMRTNTSVFLRFIRLLIAGLVIVQQYTVAITIELVFCQKAAFREGLVRRITFKRFYVNAVMTCVSLASNMNSGQQS